MAFRLAKRDDGAVHLAIKLRNGKAEKIPVLEGRSLFDEFDEFINQKGRFELGWVPIGTEDYPEYIRYEEVVSVRAVLTD